MKKLIFFLPLIFLFTGCIDIDIVEEITINPDKSGNVSIYMDIGKIGNIAMNLAEDYMQGPLMDQIKKLPETIAGLLKSVNGLSNIKSVANKKGLYAVNFDFKNVKQLNAAIYKIFHIKKKFFEPNYLRITKKKLVKKNYASVLRLIISKFKDQLKKASVLGSVNYKSVFHLPKPVKRYSNSKYTLSADKKTLEFKCTLQELLTTSVNIGNKAKF